MFIIILYLLVHLSNAGSCISSESGYLLLFASNTDHNPWPSLHFLPEKNIPLFMRKLKDENQKHSRPFYEVLYGTNLTYKIDYSNDKDGPYDSCQEYFDEANLQIIPGIVQRTFLSESSEFSVIHDYFQAFHKYPYTYIQVCDRSIINLKIQHVVLEYFQSSDVANSILIRDFVLLKTKAKDAKKFRLNSTQTYDCKCDFGSFDSSDKHIDGEIIWGKWWFEGED